TVATLLLHTAIGKHLLEQAGPASFTVELQLPTNIRQPQSILARALQSEQVTGLGIDEHHPPAGIGDQYTIAHLCQADLEKARQRLLALFFEPQPLNVLFDYLILRATTAAPGFGPRQHGAN